MPMSNKYHKSNPANRIKPMCNCRGKDCPSAGKRNTTPQKNAGSPGPKFPKGSGPRVTSDLAQAEKDWRDAEARGREK